MPFVFYVAIPGFVALAYLNHERGHTIGALLSLGAPLAPVFVHLMALEFSWLRTQQSLAPTLVADVVGLGIAMAMTFAAILILALVKPREEAPELQYTSEAARESELLLT